MKLKKPLVALLTTSLLVSPIVAGAEANVQNAEDKPKTTQVQVKEFPDIKNHWAKSSIEFLAERDILHGMPDGSFKPDNSITREEAVKVLVKTLGVEVKEQKSKFPDVPEGFWAEEYINVAKDESIIKGYPNGKFGLGDKLTRGQMASILVRAFGLPVDYNKELPYPDVKENHWAYYDILALHQNGAVKGLPDGTFAPNKEITRAEFSAFVERIINPENIKDEDKTPPKNPSPSEIIKSFNFEIDHILEEGQEQPLVLKIEFADGTIKDVTKETTFEVEKPEIAVIQNDKLKALKEGTTKLIAKYKDETVYTVIEVKAKEEEEKPSEQNDGNNENVKEIKGFKFIWDENNKFWVDEKGYIYTDLPEVAPIESGVYIFGNPRDNEKRLYSNAVSFIIFDGLDLTKDEFINAVKTLNKTKQPVKVKNITFDFDKYDGENSISIRVP
ncbi:S-layer homology domain-containing protein [Pallidibacillus pasinlerensis]|uniref:S-layer homology domain-containing protein n=1 Tax=Pallidibacillus pasinlerensis TaxID=2703818 RepID=A0ABX0A6H4_9BACI|nr:S-layer homology domain-containing protein [Pallidibacillus pasinlerensis]NCU19066.1 S-layer homology domain-containing protein [Pallidibacillus pasinlerensis]